MTPELQRASERYVQTLAEVRLHRASIETLFFEVPELLHAGSIPLQHEGGQSPLERLSDAEYQRLETRLEGILLGRDEVIVMDRDPDFFLALAKRYGGPADVAFFRAYKRTYPGIVIPVYEQQVTDYSVCSIYGQAHFLSSAYARWTAYRRQYPNRYRQFVADQIQQTSNGISSRDGACVCEGPAAVIDELTYFLREFPSSSISDESRLRLAEVRNGHSKDRFDCSPQ